MTHISSLRSLSATFTRSLSATFIRSFLLVLLPFSLSFRLSAQTPSWGAFWEGNDGDHIVMDKYTATDSEDPWCYNQRTFLRVRAWNTNRTSNNYIQLFFWIENWNDFTTTTYTDGVGPKEGSWPTNIPYVYNGSCWKVYYEDYLNKCYIGYDPTLDFVCSYSSYGANVKDITASGDGNWSKSDITSFSDYSIQVSVGEGGNIYIEISNPSQLVATIGKKDTKETIFINLTSNLDYEDNTEAETDPYVRLSGSGTGSDTKDYEVQLSLKWDHTTGSFTEADIDFTQSWFRLNGVDVEFTSITGTITESSEGTFKLVATLKGKDGNEYNVISTHSHCPKPEPFEGGKKSSFSVYNDDDVIQIGNAAFPEASDWYYTDKNKFWTIHAQTNSSSATYNYVQLYFWINTDSELYTYSDGKQGVKPGTYNLQIPRVVETGHEQYYNPYTGRWETETTYAWYVNDQYYNNCAIGLYRDSYWGVCPASSWAVSNYYDGFNPNYNSVSSMNSATIVVKEGKDGHIYIEIWVTPEGKTNPELYITINEPKREGVETYKLTVEHTGEGNVNVPTSECDYAEGDRVVITPYCEDGWEFEGWSGVCAGQLEDNGDGTWTFTMGDHDCSLTANCKKVVETKTDVIDTCSAALPFIWRPWNNGGIEITSAAQNGIKDIVYMKDKPSVQDSIITLQLNLHNPQPPVEVIDTFWQCEYHVGENDYIYLIIEDDDGNEITTIDMRNPVNFSYEEETKDEYGCNLITKHEVIIIPEKVEQLFTYCQNDFFFVNYDDVTDTIFNSFIEDNYTLEGREFHNFGAEGKQWRDTIITTIHESTHCPGMDSVTIDTVRIFPSYRIPFVPQICQDELDEALANGDISFFGTTITDRSQNGLEFVTDGTVANMCDSVWYLDLDAIPLNDTTYESMTVCSYPVEWKGKTYYSEDEFRTKPHITPTEGCNAYTILIPIEAEQKEDVKDTIAVCPHQLPYEWDGMTFTQAGTQTREAENACDANVSHTLIVIDGIIQAGDTVCESRLPYTWEGETITAADLTDNGAGFMTVTLDPKTLPSSLVGCDSTVQFTLTVIPEHTYDHVTVCENELPAFSWHVGDMDIPVHSEADAQNTQVTLPSVLGCDSTVHLDLTVLPAKTEALGTHYIKDTESYTVFGGTEFEQTYTSDCIDCQATGKTEAGCDSTVTFTVIVRNIETENIYKTICASELPYIWNGIECTQSDEYTFPTKTVQGDLDSLAILHLTVNPEYTDKTDGKTICQNELPYEWKNGDVTVMTFTANDSYTDIDDQTFYREETVNVRTVAGCDSVVTFRLTVHRTYNNTDGTTVCRSLLPYLWKDRNGTVVETFDDAGTKQHTFQTVHGCDSTVTFTLTVADEYDNLPTEETICESRLPYEWTDKDGTVVETFYEAGSKTHTFQSVFGCDSVVTLTLNVISEVEPTVTEQTICDNLLPYTWGQLTFYEAGTQTQTFESSHGCDSVVTLTLNVNPTYNLTDGKTICRSELPFTWEGETFTDSGTRTKTLRTVEGCDSVVTFTLTVQTPTNDVKNDKVCDNQLPYVWDPTDGFAPFKQEYYEAGTYNYTLKSSIGCDSIYYTLNLTIDRDYVYAQPAVATTEICANDDALRIALNTTAGNPAAYDIVFDERATAQGLANISHETIPADHIISVAIPHDEDSTRYLRPDDYSLTLTIYDECERKTEHPLQFKVLYPSWLIQQRWRDVLALYNEKYNGGYTFSVIRWFKNGTEMTGQGVHNSYVQVTPVLEMTTYYTLLTRADDGKTFRTCDFTPNLASPYYAPETEKIRLEQHSDSRHITVKTNLSGSYRVYDVTGKEIMSGQFGEAYGNPQIVFAPACPDGAYIIRFQANEGTEDTKKWLIR